MTTIDEYLNGTSMFDWYLEYQQTDEFKADETVQRLRETAYNTQAMSKYYAKHPTFRKLREEARKHRAELLRAQDGKCHWCKQLIMGESHIDHKIPLIKGGDSSIENLCATCPNCNRKRHMKVGKRSGISQITLA